MNHRLLASSLLLALASGSSQLLAADFTPIPLAEGAFNQDVIVERTATPPPAPTTSASMDAGTGNTGFSWYEQGLSPDSPSSGLPAAGQTLTSETFADHSYRLAPSYTTNNGVLIDAAVTNATLTLSTPAAYSLLSFLTAAGHGPMTVALTVHHADGSVETNSLVSPDWFGGTNQAFTANGRVNVATRAFDNVDAGNPRLYSVDLPLSSASSPVTSIDFHYTTGAGAAAIFALSGGSAAAGVTPIAVTGFNQDFVVEASAPPLPTSLDATTASLDAGVANTGASYYEQGYNAAAPTTGLPAPGTTLTNSSATDHRFTLPSTYAGNNAVLIDVDIPSATLNLVSPAAYSGLSFLTAAGGGAVTIDYVITHSDGSTQTGSFTSPDWFNNTPFAFAANGRVNVVTGLFDAMNSGNPRLYAVDVGVTASSSQISSITLNYAAGNGHAVILAVSGASGGIRPIIDVQPASTNVFSGSSVQFLVSASGTPPLSFQWQVSTNGTFRNVANGGNISGVTTTNLMLSNITLANAGGYQLIASNVFGVSTSQVAQLNVLSTATDVTSPTDEVISVGGNSPAAESVQNAIDDTTSKYLNFGTDTNETAPFVGPAGLIVTPAMGSTVVTGLRVYTANDAVDRDPVDYRLEGSNNGTNNFVLVSSGSLSLPDTRNAAGLSLDPIAQPNQEVLFQNTAGYTTYRLTFANVKNNANANSVQIGEIELLGTPGTGTPSVRVTISRGPGNSLTITSSAPGTLQSTTALGGANTSWQDLGPINGSTTVTPTGTATFYRVVPQQQ